MTPQPYRYPVWEDLVEAHRVMRCGALAALDEDQRIDPFIFNFWMQPDHTIGLMRPWTADILHAVFTSPNGRVILGHVLRHALWPETVEAMGSNAPQLVGVVAEGSARGTKILKDETIAQATERAMQSEREPILSIQVHAPKLGTFGTADRIQVINGRRVIIAPKELRQDCRLTGELSLTG